MRFWQAIKWGLFTDNCASHHSPPPQQLTWPYVNCQPNEISFSLSISLSVQLSVTFSLSVFLCLSLNVIVYYSTLLFSHRPKPVRCIQTSRGFQRVPWLYEWCSPFLIVKSNLYHTFCHSPANTQPLPHQLQLILNSTAGIMTCSKSTSHKTPLFLQLHWLPVAFQIKCKILLLTFQGLHNPALTYLTNLCSLFSTSLLTAAHCCSLLTAAHCCSLLTAHCSLQSSSLSSLLTILDTILISMGGRALCHVDPKLWNFLPCHIWYCGSIAKNALKAYLFGLAY